jgi:hypothetical protein
VVEWKADKEGRKAGRKAYEEKMMAKWKANQKRREAERKSYEKRMVKWKADQEIRMAERKAYEEKRMAEQRANQKRREAERKAHQEDLQKIMKEIIDANQTKTNNNQEEMDVNLKETREEIKFGQAEIKSTVNAFQEEMDVSIANRKDDRKEATSCQETTACHEVMDADLEKTDPDAGMMQSVADHQVALKEDAIVKPVKERKKRHRGQKLAAGRCGEPKELTRGDCGSGRKLAAACRKVSSCATVAWRKRNLLRKIGTQENCGPHKEFTATRIRMIHCARVAWLRRGVVRKDYTRVKVSEKPSPQNCCRDIDTKAMIFCSVL